MLHVALGDVTKGIYYTTKRMIMLYLAIDALRQLLSSDGSVGAWRLRMLSGELLWTKKSAMVATSCCRGRSDH